MPLGQIGKGLTTAEAAERLKADGFNQLPAPPRRNTLAIVREVLREPMFQLLLAAGLIYLTIGDIAEALMLVCFVQISIWITVIQERRAENALAALRDLVSPRALVIRDGQQQSIDSREIVRGDLLVLVEGDRVAADGVIITAQNLLLDESLLTGESLPVAKQADVGQANDDQTNRRVASGTMVVAGHGVAQVVATGLATEIGRIGRSLGELIDEPTRLHAQTKRLVRIFGTIGVALSAAAVLVIGLVQGEWLQGLLSGITLAMSVLPEEFAVVLTVFIAMGAWRISRHRVLTRRSSTIEMLGAATVLCTDKTGTLTENRMSVSALWMREASWQQGSATPPSLLAPLLETAMLASKPAASDPMEHAIQMLMRRSLHGTSHQDSGWHLEREYPLSPTQLSVSHVWRSPQGDYRVATKGAPETIIGLCRLSAEEAAQVRLRVDAYAAQGMRVLGVAHAQHQDTPMSADQSDLGLMFLGLVAFADPLRGDVPAAVSQCHAAGIRVVMITGDYPNTAIAIARQAGIISQQSGQDVLITGDMLNVLSDDELRTRVETVRVYARIRPEQKLRIVQALKANGETVAMTGDGVNDAPALKAAHIGIAMGGRGTDVAREAASLVLLQDDFASIVKAIEQGRRIYANLKKALAYIISIHIPIAGLAVLPLAFGAPMLFFPAHVAFLELVIDPTSCFVFESEPGEKDLMTDPPRPTTEPLFSGQTLVASILAGVGLLVVLAGLYLTLRGWGVSLSEIRASCFVGLVVGGIMITLSSLSGNRISGLRQALQNRAFWILSLIALLMLTVVFSIAPIRELFQFAAISWQMVGWVAVCNAIAAMLILITKWIPRFS